MKVIYLLNKIANDEIKDGTKFIFKNHSGFFNGKTKRLYLNINGTVDLIRYYGLKILNDEVEIIEEPREKCEDLEEENKYLKEKILNLEFHIKMQDFTIEQQYLKINHPIITISGVTYE